MEINYLNIDGDLSSQPIGYNNLLSHDGVDTLTIDINTDQTNTVDLSNGINSGNSNAIISSQSIDGSRIISDSITVRQLNFVPTTNANIIATINASAEGITIAADNISIGGTTTFGAGYDPTTRLLATGGSYASAASGARVLIFPDANTGIQITDGTNDVFKVLVGGADVGDVTIGNYSGGQGILYDKSVGTINYKNIKIGTNVENSTGTVLPEELVLNYDNYEAAENIADEDIVCLKPNYTDIYLSEDSYVNGDHPDTNYGTATNMYMGAYQVGTDYTFIKFDRTDANIPNPEYILKAELGFYVSYDGTGAGGTVLTFRPCDADWAEGTITYNNMPAATTMINDSILGEETLTVPYGTYYQKYIYFDVTQYVRKIKAGNINNYGLRIERTSGTANYIAFATSESDTKPVLRIWRTDKGDGKVYKAKSSDYLLCRSVIGIAQETITSGNNIKVQTQNIVKNIDFGTVGVGGNLYLDSSNAGGYIFHTTSIDRTIIVGKVISRYSLKLDIFDKDVPIEKYTDGAVNTTHVVYAPVDARYVDVQWYFTGNKSLNTIRVYRDSLGISAKHIRDYWSAGGDVTCAFVVSWSSNYVTIDAIDTAHYPQSIVFYT